MMTLLIIFMSIVGMAILSAMGISLVVGFLIVLAIAAVVSFVGALFSWPVLLGLFIAWLVFRDKKPKQPRYSRYYSRY